MQVSLLFGNKKHIKIKTEKNAKWECKIIINAYKFNGQLLIGLITHSNDFLLFILCLCMWSKICY